MSLQWKYKEETGFDVYTMYDIRMIYYGGDYVEWLENKLNTTCNKCTVDKSEGYGKAEGISN